MDFSLFTFNPNLALVFGRDFCFILNGFSLDFSQE